MHTLPLVDAGSGGREDELQLRGAVREYQTVRRAKNYARETLRNEGYHLVEFTRIVGDDFAVGRLNRKHIERFIACQNLSEGAMRNKLSSIRGFCRWAVATGRLRHNPAEAIDLPKVPRRLPRECDEAAVEKLYANLPDSRAVLIVSLMRQELLRRKEVAGLEVGDIDLTTRWLFVREGKGGHEREVPISDDTEAALHAYLRECPAASGPLVRSYVHPRRGLTPGRVGHLVAEWMQEAGLKRFPHDGKSAHALRHTGAGRMLDDGADIRDVQEALGHANLSATWGYLRGRRGKARLAQFMGRHAYLVPSGQHGGGGADSGRSDPIREPVSPPPEAA